MEQNALLSGVNASTMVPGGAAYGLIPSAAVAIADGRITRVGLQKEVPQDYSKFPPSNLDGRLITLPAARAFASTATDLENDLVEALAQRIQKPYGVSGEEFDRWDNDYAEAMRRVYYSAKDDHDVAAIFAEAAMTRTPWRLWNVKKGIPHTNSEALEVIERAMAIQDAAGGPQHPRDFAPAYPRNGNVRRAGAFVAGSRYSGHTLPGRRAHEPYAWPHLCAVRRI